MTSLRVRLYSSCVSRGMGSLKGFSVTRYGVLSGNRTAREGSGGFFGGGHVSFEVRVSGGGGGNGSSVMA